MAIGFRDGFDYFQKNSSTALASFQGGDFGVARSEYVGTVEDEITALEESINAFLGDHTPDKQLKGKIAEFWQAGTFNVNAATNESAHRVVVDQSTDFGSVDISSNFGDKFGLKYYATGEDSAKQQAISVFQRFKAYEAKGGKDSLDKYLADRLYSSQDVLNDPVYSGQVRVIPKDQLEEATTYLKRIIATESARRPEQVNRYKETLDLLTDRLSDNEGNESIPLSKNDAEVLAAIAKEGKFSAEDYGISAPELLNLEMVVKESLKAGLSAAIISLVLKVAPEVFKSVDYLIKQGKIDRDAFKRVGFAAINGFSEGFVRGSVAAAITACCKSGVFGEAMKEISPGVIGTIVVITMNTMKNSYQVAIGKKTRTELSNELIRDMFISSSALALGYVGQTILHQLPVVGYLVGSFAGSIVGSFVYQTVYKTAISFCAETGVTLFGLVDQDYRLPDDIIEEIGIKSFDYDTFDVDTFEPESFSFESFEPETFQPDTLGIKMLRRGVIGVTKVGYI